MYPVVTKHDGVQQPYKVGLIQMVLRLRKAVVYCASSVSKNCRLRLLERCSWASFHSKVSGTLCWKLRKLWTILISQSTHRDTRLVEFFTCLMSNDLSQNSASNSVRLFLGLSAYVTGLSPSWNIARLSIHNVSIASHQWSLRMDWGILGCPFDFSSFVDIWTPLGFTWILNFSSRSASRFT